MSRALCRLALTAILLVLAWPGQANAQSDECELGAYVSDLRGFDLAENAYKAQLWVWSVCDDPEAEDPLETLSFTNGHDIHTDSYVRRIEDGKAWGLYKVEGSFVHGWDVRRFPFDRQTLGVLMTAPKDVDEVRLTADEVDSGYSEHIHLQGWKLNDIRIEPTEREYHSTFGDPKLEGNQTSTYSQVLLQIDLERDDPVAFWKIAGPMYIIFLIACSALLLIPNVKGTLGAALGSLGGLVFATIVNMQRTGTILPSQTDLTMLDGLHLLTLAFIMAAMIFTVIAWRQLNVIPEDAGEGRVTALQSKIDRLNHRLAWVAIAGYVGASAALIGLALATR